MTDGPRDAASVVLMRRGPDGASVLMGLRGARAAFLPSKSVFPGGAVDPGDDAPTDGLSPACVAALGRGTSRAPGAVVGAALRELREETGLRLRRGAPLRFVFRAITPAGRPRRYDARFLLASAEDVAGDPDDFSLADGELSHLAWVPVGAALARDLPFVTELVLSEAASVGAARGVPFLDSAGLETRLRRL